MFELVELSMDDPGVMAGLILQAIWYLGLISMTILGLQCALSFVCEVAHKIYPKITYSGFSAMSYLENGGHLIIYAVKAAVAVFIISHVMHLLPVPVVWGLWILLGWTVLWRFPFSGLYALESFLFYGSLNLVSQKAAQIVWDVYVYTHHKIISAAAAFMGLKYILLPIYAPESAAFIEEIVLFAIVLHYLWYFPFVGPVGIWSILPKRWIEKHDPEGRDIPAKVSLRIEGTEAIIKISNCLVPIQGIGKLNVVRGHNSWPSFKFKIEPGEAFFEITVDLQLSDSPVYPLWYTDLTLSVSGPGLEGTRTFFPEKRGISQRIMEWVYSLPSTVRVLYRECV